MNITKHSLDIAEQLIYNKDRNKNKTKFIDNFIATKVTNLSSSRSARDGRQQS